MKDKVYLRKKDEELEDICLKRMYGQIVEEHRPKIREMLQYNMLTAKQVADLTQLDISTISNKIRNPKRNEKGELETELDPCFPFANLDNRGPKFIIRNAKLEELLKNGRQRT